MCTQVMNLNLGNFSDQKVCNKARKFLFRAESFLSLRQPETIRILHSVWKLVMGCQLGHFASQRPLVQ